jgi:16S rRNA (guanine966-N2)-methyltransferase
MTALRGGLAGTAVLDLFAGSGAVGLEALSRGAADVLLVESDARATGVIRANIAAVGLPGARVIADRVDRVLARGPGEWRARDFVFADPPYAAGDDELARVLGSLCGQGWLAAGAVVAVERASRSGPPPWPPELASDRSRRYGDATLWYGLAAGAEPAGTASTGA